MQDERAKILQENEELRSIKNELQRIHSRVDKAALLEFATLCIKNFGTPSTYLNLQYGAKDIVAFGIISLKYSSVTVDSNFKTSADELWCATKNSNNSVFRFVIKHLIPDKATWVNMNKNGMYLKYADEIAAAQGNFLK
jgi:hypothetical protein